MTTNKNVTKSFILKAVINPMILDRPVYTNANTTNRDSEYSIVAIKIANVFIFL